MPRKKEVVSLDTSASSSERSSSLLLIEYVDMGELIKDLIKTKVPPPVYCPIQEFLTKVCMMYYCLIHSFHAVPHLFIFYFLWIFAFQAGAGPYSSKPKVHTGIDILFADVRENLHEPSTSASSSDAPQ